jgi:hypothetical protein
VRTVVRRLRRLEDRFGPAMETEFSRRLRERIEAGRRRVAEARERGELEPCAEVRPDDVQNGRQTIAEFLQSARRRWHSSDNAVQPGPHPA